MLRVRSRLFFAFSLFSRIALPSSPPVVGRPGNFGGGARAEQSATPRRRAPEIMFRYRH